MSIRGLAHRTRLTAARSADPSTLPIATPWHSAELQRIVFEDIFGTDVPVNTRTAAMRIPAVKRARNLVVATVGRLPLRQVDATSAPLPTQPGWLTSTATSSPIMRLVWTVDDLMFYGWSAWITQRASDGTLLDAVRLNQDEWEVTADNVVRVNGRDAKPGEVIVFAGLDAGILEHGVDALKDTRALYSVVRQRLINPVPNIDLHQVSGAEMSNEQIDTLIARWAKARQGVNGGVGFTNQHIEAKVLGDSDAALMIDARNAAAVEMARLVGVHAGSIDATAPKASLNYETATGRNQEFVDLDLWAYLLPVEARLSMDDCVAPGSRVAFDLSDYTTPTPAPYGATRED